MIFLNDYDALQMLGCTRLMLISICVGSLSSEIIDLFKIINI